MTPQQFIEAVQALLKLDGRQIHPGERKAA